MQFLNASLRLHRFLLSMKYFAISSIVFLMSIPLYGQLLNNKLGEAFTDKPFFNERIVAQNQIESITGKFILKKMGDVMRETRLKRAYYFDENGRLIKRIETTQAKEGQDTLITFFEYDPRGNLTVMRRKDQYGYYATYYDYDSLNRVIREEHKRNLNKAKEPFAFELGDEFIVSYETSSYENYDGQEKRTVFNSYGVPYRDEITYTNEYGQITEVVDRLRRTSGINQKRYIYNDKGLLDTLLIISNQSGRQERLYTFEYDEYNNLIAKQYFKNGDHQTEYQLLYDNKTGLMNYILTREVATNYITILKLDQYNFHDSHRKPIRWNEDKK